MNYVFKKYEKVRLKKLTGGKTTHNLRWYRRMQEKNVKDERTEGIIGCTHKRYISIVISLIAVNAAHYIKAEVCCLATVSPMYLHSYDTLCMVPVESSDIFIKVPFKASVTYWCLSAVSIKLRVNRSHVSDKQYTNMVKHQQNLM